MRKGTNKEYLKQKRVIITEENHQLGSHDEIWNKAISIA
jgi:hypothetical protein